MARAQSLDPLSMIINTSVGTIHYLNGETDMAIGKFRSALEIDPQFLRAHFELGRALEIAGRPEQALAEIEKARGFDENAVSVALARTYAKSGRTEEARQILQRLLTSSDDKISPYDIAAIHEALGERDEVFRWLDKAYEARTGRLAYLAVEPMFASVREDPRFASVMARIGGATKTPR